MMLKPKAGIEELKVYEPGRPLEETAREFGLNPSELVKLASNENALGPSPAAVEAMKAEADRMHLYPDGGGFYLRNALAKELWVEPDTLLFGNGSNEIIEFLGHVFLGPGTNLVMSQGAFVIYKLVADAFGAETRMAPMQDFAHDLDAMLDLIDDNTRLVFVANPNNPTGTRVSNQALNRFRQKIPPHVLLVLDEAYVELLDEEEQPDSLEWAREDENVLVMRTFSKTYGLAGLRIGYAVAAPPVIQLLNKFRQPFNVNAMAQAAALAAIQDRDHVERSRKLVADGLRYFERECAALGLETVPSHANFLMIKVGEGRQRFIDLQKIGVITRPMDGYGFPDHLRVTIGTRDENERMMAALKEVLA